MKEPKPKLSNSFTGDILGRNLSIIYGGAGADYHTSAVGPYQRPQPLWVWNGRRVSILEFASLAYGDTKQRTMFLLEYGDKE
jgi:hypothetical protein